MIDMAWNSPKSSGDIISSSDHNDMTTSIDTRTVGSSGAGAPTSTPSTLPSFYLDTTNNKFYVAIGTSSSADWKKAVISS